MNTLHLYNCKTVVDATLEVLSPLKLGVNLVISLHCHDCLYCTMHGQCSTEWTIQYLDSCTLNVQVEDVQSGATYCDFNTLRKTYSHACTNVHQFPNNTITGWMYVCMWLWCVALHVQCT